MMHTDLKVGMYWGERGVDYWNAETWKKEVDEHEVHFYFLVVASKVEMNHEELPLCISPPPFYASS